jgi:hypothetical protein
MADYINIYGQDILAVASDPANPTVGQIWYNTTSNTLKGLSYAAGSWAAGNNMNTARRVLAGAGTQTAAIGFGGILIQLIQEQLKNTMELVGQHLIL